MRAIAAYGLAAATLCGLFAAQVRAADLSPLYPPPPVYAEPDQQFEFGTGWYLRGDVGYSDSAEVQPFGALPKLTSSTDWTGGVGAGYRWTDWFRTDLTLNFDGYQHLSGIVAGAPCTGSFGTDFCDTRNQASLLRTDVMAGGYVDLGSWYGVTPYVGAGVGFARVDTWTGTRSTSATTGAPYAELADDTHRTLYNFAWSLMGGVAYAVDSHLSLDLGYRYINLGDYRNPDGRNKTLDAQQVRLGLRYAID